MKKIKTVSEIAKALGLSGETKLILHEETEIKVPIEINNEDDWHQAYMQYVAGVRAGASSPFDSDNGVDER